MGGDASFAGYAPRKDSRFPFSFLLSLWRSERRKGVGIFTTPGEMQVVIFGEISSYQGNVTAAKEKKITNGVAQHITTYENAQ